MYIERLKRNYVLLDRPIAHKAVHDDNIHGNSLDSIKLAIAMNIPFEIDVIKTADNIPIVYHDFNIVIQDKTYTIASLNLDTLLSLTKNSVYIPTLFEVVELNRYAKVPMVLDIKDANFLQPTTFRKNIVRLLTDYTGEFSIQSFNPFALVYMKYHLKSALIGQLLCRGKTVVDTFDFIKKHDGIAVLYEKIQSFICVISQADYISLEMHPSKKWKNKIQKLVFHKMDYLQNKIVGVTCGLTNTPIIGWTLTKEEDTNFLPEFFRNYIYDIPEGYDYTYYEDFEKKITKKLDY